MSLAVYLALLFVLMADGEEMWFPAIRAELGALGGAPEAGPDAQVSVGSVGLAMGEESDLAGVTFTDVDVSQGQVALHLPKVTTALDLEAGFQGELRPEALKIEGAALRFQRSAAGQLLFSAGRDHDVFSPILGDGTGFDLAALLDRIKSLGGAEMLSSLKDLALEDVSVSFDDAARGQHWKSHRASAKLEREGALMRASLFAEFSIEGRAEETRTRITTSLTDGLANGEMELRLRLDHVSPADLANQFRALDWLRIVSAPMGGDLTLRFDRNGRMIAMLGVLEAGEGTLNAENGQSLHFARAKAYFTYDPARDRIAIDAVDLDSAYGHFRGSGSLLLARDQAGQVEALTSQLDLASSQLKLPHLSQPIDIHSGQMAGRITLSPFHIDIASAHLMSPIAALSASGAAWPDEEGWNTALNAKAPELDAGDVLALWPETLRPGLRRWLGGHVLGGTLQNAEAYLRAKPGGKPDLGFEFDFSDANVSIRHSLPAIEEGAGHFSMRSGKLALEMTGGHTRGGGQKIALAGTSFRVADLRLRPVVAVAEVLARGDIPSLLAFADHAPLSALSRSGLEGDVATGEGQVLARIELPLIKKLRAADLDWRVQALLNDVDAPRLVPGRPILSPALTLDLTREKVTVSGPLSLGGADMDVTYARALRGNADGAASVVGQMAVTQANLDTLGIPLPRAAFGGTGAADFELDLVRGSAPRYRAEVDLAGAEISLPSLHWAKSGASEGQLSLSGRLGDAPTVDTLALRAPGLLAEGALRLNGPDVAEARFSRLRVGRWLDAPLIWRKGGRVDVAGGLLDLRHVPVALANGSGDGAAGQGQGQGQRSTTLSLAPSKLRVTDKITLTRFKGALKGAAGGRFSALINGGAEVEGVLRDGGTLYLTSRDGGQALADADILRNISGGTLRVSLTPAGQGRYEGRFSLQEARATKAPLLANLLSVVSLVGLIDKLEGDGIGFEDAQGWFTLSPGKLSISRARAVGASLGMTLSGDYVFGQDSLAMEGVVSPLYALNGLPARLPLIGRLFGARDGEGLLGATFRLTGSAKSPQVAVNPLSVLAPGAAREIFLSRGQGAPADPLRN